MSKRFLIILAVLVIAFGGFIVLNKNKKTNTDGSVGEASVSSHTQGAGNQGVTLVEYGDFECNACGTYYPIIEQVKQKYGDNITFQFRSFPLTQIHKNAMTAHRAAEAANKQGKFWEMYNLLYSQQQTWASASNAARIMEDFALQLSLNIDQFKRDLASETVNKIINADIAAGQQLGVNSTPTFFLNGKKLEPSPERSVDAFSKVIDEAIQNRQ